MEEGYTSQGGEKKSQKVWKNHSEENTAGIIRKKNARWK